MQVVGVRGVGLGGAGIVALQVGLQRIEFEDGGAIAVGQGAPLGEGKHDVVRSGLWPEAGASLMTPKACPNSWASRAR